MSKIVNKKRFKMMKIGSRTVVSGIVKCLNDVHVLTLQYYVSYNSTRHFTYLQIYFYKAKHTKDGYSL